MSHFDDTDAALRARSLQIGVAPERVSEVLLVLAQHLQGGCTPEELDQLRPDSPAVLDLLDAIASAHVPLAKWAESTGVPGLAEWAETLAAEHHDPEPQTLH